MVEITQLMAIYFHQRHCCPSYYESVFFTWLCASRTSCRQVMEFVCQYDYGMGPIQRFLSCSCNFHFCSREKKSALVEFKKIEAQSFRTTGSRLSVSKWVNELSVWAKPVARSIQVSGRCMQTYQQKRSTMVNSMIKNHWAPSSSCSPLHFLSPHPLPVLKLLHF